MGGGVGGRAGGRGVGGRAGGGGWEAEGGPNHPLAVRKSRQSTKTATVYMSGQDGRWEQFDTTCSLISAPQWHHTPHSGPSRIYMVR